MAPLTDAVDTVDRAAIVGECGAENPQSPPRGGVLFPIGAADDQRSAMSEEFDPAFYVAWYGQEVEVDTRSARQHWEKGGLASGLHPTFESLLAQHELHIADLPPDFDWVEYIALNPDLPQDWDRWRATFHWLSQGSTEKRIHSSPPLLEGGTRDEAQLIVALDAEWYTHTYGVADGESRQHYLHVGRLNFLAPNANFSPIDYLERYSDVAKAGIDPVIHYVANGHGEGRSFQPADSAKESRRDIHAPSAIHQARKFFALDVEFYRSIRPDLASLDDLDLELHFEVHGDIEGSRPSRYFDPKYYRSRYAEELERWSGGALDHFLHIGLLQNFFPSPEVLSGARRAQVASPVAWVGHWLSESGFSPLPKIRSGDQPVSRRVDAIPKSEAAERRVLNWIIPRFSKGGGGHYNIFRLARTLSRLGWQSVFWIDGSITDRELDDLAAEFIGHYPVSPGSFRMVSDGFSEVEGEFLIATAWTTAYTGLQNQNRNARVYLVQDRESLFGPAGTEALQAEWTFHLGYDYICAGQWLEQLVEGAGESQTFELCPEPSSSARDPRVDERQVLAVIYIRTHTARRCSEMMIAVANRLAKEALGEVVVIGDASASGVDPAVVNVGTLPMDEMTALFQRAKFGLVASATNYSILPIEMAAAGMVVVQPYSSSTQATSGRQGAHSTEPTVESLVNFILEGSRDLDQAQFDQLRGTYRTFALSLSWESEFEKIASWLEAKVKPQHAGGVLKRPTATVVIPTYYPDEGFLEVVESVRRQLSSFDVTLQIVDSRRNGECSQVIREIEADGDANVHVIDATDFQHGRTRNLAAGLSQSDFYAYLTQDAIPASEYWLEALLSPFLILPHCAYTVGRHRAYDDHHPLYGLNLDRHFDSIAEHGFVTSRREHAERFSVDPWFAANLSFNSDNNAGYRGDLLRRHGFPLVPFAEDQAISYKFLRLGYYRVYTPSSVVIHSHDYTQDPTEAFRRGAEEADSIFQNFSLIRFENLRSVLDAKLAVEQAAFSDAARLGLRADAVASYVHSAHQSIEGAWRASREILRKGTSA